MIALVALAGLALGAWTGFNLGFNRAVDHYADEAISAAEARRARDRRGASWWPFVIVGVFVIVMVALGLVARGAP